MTSHCDSVDSGLRQRAKSSQSFVGKGCCNSSSVMKEGGLEQAVKKHCKMPKDVIKKVSPPAPTLRAGFSSIPGGDGALY